MRQLLGCWGAWAAASLRSTETISSAVSYSPEPSPDISPVPAGGQQDTGTACTLCTHKELLCPFCQVCWAPSWEEATMLDEVPALQMSKTLPWITNHLRVQTEPLFLLSCCFTCVASTCVSALLLCVWGETWAVHTHGAGAQPSLTRQLQLHPLQTHAWARWIMPMQHAKLAHWEINLGHLLVNRYSFAVRA